MTTLFPARLTTIALMAGIVFVPAAHGQSASACSDSTVAEVVREVSGRSVRGLQAGGECDPNLYGGSWTSREELRSRVGQTLTTLRVAGLEFAPDGRSLIDSIYDQRILLRRAPYVGPRQSAPSNRNWSIDLPNDHVLELNRRCARGYVVQRESAVCVASSG